MGCAHFEGGTGYPPVEYPRPKQKEACDKDKESSDKDKESSDAGAGLLGLRWGTLLSNDDAREAYRISQVRHPYLVVFRDRYTAEAATPELKEAHRKHLYELTASDKLELVSRTISGDKGFQIILAASRQEAEAIVRSDPLIKHNYFKAYDIEELVLPYSRSHPEGVPLETVCAA